MRVIVKLAPMHVMLADVIQTLKFSDNCSIVSVRNEA
jgi:hypothetical protein